METSNLDPALFPTLQETLAGLAASHGPDALARIVQGIMAATGAIEPYYPDPRQRPATFFLPGLPARPWYDRDEHESLSFVTRTLEAAFPAIQGEAARLLDARQGWETYIKDDRMREKFSSLAEPDWCSLPVRSGGRDVAATRALCPRTSTAVDAIADHLMSGGEVFFSLLRPGAAIPPHHDETNFKLTVHLPLIVPPDCAIAVGGEARTWLEGQCLVFDDTFRHEAWNRSDRDRVCLLLDIWHPEVTAVEREALAALVNVVVPSV